MYPSCLTGDRTIGPKLEAEHAQQPVTLRDRDDFIQLMLQTQQTFFPECRGVNYGTPNRDTPWENELRPYYCGGPSVYEACDRCANDPPEATSIAKRRSQLIKSAFLCKAPPSYAYTLRTARYEAADLLVCTNYSHGSTYLQEDAIFRSPSHMGASAP